MNASIFLWSGLLSVVAADETGPRTMRLDFHHTGNRVQEIFAVDRVVREPLEWPGNPRRPLDVGNLGAYFFEVRDAESGKPIYSRGFSSIFGEWATTAEAKQTHRTFHESLRFPEPAAPVVLHLSRRDPENRFQEIWKTKIDPKSMYVDRATPPAPAPLLEIERNGPPSTKVDLLILGDGYTAQESGKFEARAKAMAERLFAASPFKERRRDFNVWGLCPAAPESGVTRPSSGVHRASPLRLTYDVFGSERYLLSFDNSAFRTIASFAPYDFVVILANNRTYGGGGIFGVFGTVAADSVWAPYVFVHEFGHHFADLADEYYTSPVAYLPAAKKIEPWQPNVTALLNPAEIKWKKFVEPGVPLPTPWNKQEYEAWSREYQKRRDEIRARNADEAEMDALFAENKRMEDKLLAGEKFAGKVGAFEGANYEAKGYYRPAADCIMFTRTNFFCAVCRDAIDKMIDEYVLP